MGFGYSRVFQLLKVYSREWAKILYLGSWRCILGLRASFSQCVPYHKVHLHVHSECWRRQKIRENSIKCENQEERRPLWHHTHENELLWIFKKPLLTQIKQPFDYQNTSFHHMRLLLSGGLQVCLLWVRKFVYHWEISCFCSSGSKSGFLSWQHLHFSIWDIPYHWHSMGGDCTQLICCQKHPML